jgi:hypothetical protein
MSDKTSASTSPVPHNDLGQPVSSDDEHQKRSSVFSSPLVLGLFSAIFGLLGTGIGAALQGYSTLQLERQKFESSLIQKALDTKDKSEAAKSLLFLVDSGIIQSLDAARIRKIAENPEQLPILAELLSATASGGAIAPAAIARCPDLPDRGWECCRTSRFERRPTDHEISRTYRPGYGSRLLPRWSMLSLWQLG